MKIFQFIYLSISCVAICFISNTQAQDMQLSNKYESWVNDFQYFRYRNLDSCRILQNKFELSDYDSPLSKSLNYKFKGNIEHTIGNFNKAVQLYDSALFFIPSEKYSILKAYIIMDKGISQAVDFQKAKAIKTYYQALPIFKKEKDNDGLVYCYVNIGEYFRTITREQDCVYFLHKADSLVDSKTTPLHLITLYNRYAALSNRFLSKPASIDYSRKALSLAIKIGNYDYQAISYNELAYYYFNTKKLDSAKLYFEKANKLWKRVGNRRSMCTVLINQARLYGRYLDLDTSLKYLDTLEMVLGEKDWPSIAFELNSQRKANYYMQGDYKKAFYYLNKIRPIEKKLLKIKLDKEIETVHRKYQIKEKDQEIQNVKNENKAIANRNTLYGIFLIVFIILVSILAFAYQKIRKTKKLLNESNSHLQKYNKELQTTIIEKEELVREIHHRVNNNLNMLSSLAQVQKANLKNPSAIGVIDNLQNRIDVVAQLHKQLINSNQNPVVNIEDFLNTLIDNLSIDLPLENLEIQKVFNFETNEMLLKQAIPLAMIINELITNSIKHAKLNRSEGIEIVISAKIKGHNFNLYIEDNGPGLKDPKVLENPQTTGLKLIKLFTKQLNSEISYSNKEKSSFQLQFTINQTSHV